MKTFFRLIHIRIDNKEKIADQKGVWIYTTKEKAETALKEIQNKPGFRVFPEWFTIEELVLDDVHWKDWFDPNKWIYFNS